MPVTSVVQDASRLTMTLTVELAATIERVWQLLAEPRQLERWWGPPQYPATVVAHDLTPGGFVHYYVTGPQGDQPHGWWRVASVAAPSSLEVEDGFADAEGRPNPDMPTLTIRFTLEETPDGTRLTTLTRFPSLEAMEQLAAMGMEEGMKAAAGQIDEILRVPA